jgi:hypothetical protein
LQRWWIGDAAKNAGTHTTRGADRQRVAARILADVGGTFGKTHDDPTPRNSERATLRVPERVTTCGKASGVIASAVRVDAASSGSWFDGWKRSVPIAHAVRPNHPPVARARTCLLAVGWRRHRRIDPTDVPG